MEPAEWMRQLKVGQRFVVEDEEMVVEREAIPRMWGDKQTFFALIKRKFQKGQTRLRHIEGELDIFLDYNSGRRYIPIHYKECVVKEPLMT